MKKLNIVFVLSLLVLYSCSSLKVVSDYESGTDFTAYKSFSVVEVDAGETGINELNLRRIITSVRGEMAAKGMKEMDNADLEVHIHGLVKDKISADISTDYYGYRNYRRPMGFGTTTSSIDVREYQEGSLIIDLVDSAKKQLVWQGIGTANLNDNPKGREERIQKAVAKILEAYPPSM